MLNKETRSTYLSATFSHVIRLSLLHTSDGALSRNVISVISRSFHSVESLHVVTLDRLKLYFILNQFEIRFNTLIPTILL